MMSNNNKIQQNASGITKKSKSFSVFCQLLSNSLVIILICGTTLTTTTSARMLAEIAEYEEIKDLPNHPEKLLIDVREPKEIAETGQIPTAINIPLAQVEAALSLPPEEFQEKYERELKPKEEQELIFHCKLGGRAEKGAQAAMALGFINVKNYKGSWTEWAAKENL